MRLKHLLIGNPLYAIQAQAEQVSVFIGLGAFASDAVSSVAYATEEMLLVLVLANSAVSFGPAIAALIAGVLLIVISSYYQTVHA
jgi:hypothetical protein